MDDSVESICQALDVLPATVYRWIHSGKLVAAKRNGKFSIPPEENAGFIVTKLHEKWRRPQNAWMPKGLQGYNEWHQVIDYFCWLIKVCYSSRDDVKRKIFRLDKVFAHYLTSNNVTLHRIRQVFLSNTTPQIRTIENDLKRGWYNELSYCVPMKQSSLGLSFGDIGLNLETSSERFLFPSWRIISAYYAFYFYMRSMSLLKHPSFRLEEHGAAIAAFKYNLSSPLSRVVWKFPFDIAYNPGARVYRRKLLLSKVPHTVHAYSHHPRAPHYSPSAQYEYIVKVFRRRSRSKKRPVPYNLFDFFHDFRVWANYLDIDNLLSLWGQGYKAFLDQNLSTIIFFTGGISELCYVSILGEDSYLAQLQAFYDVFAANAPELESVFARTPVSQRLEIFNALGLIRGKIRLTQRRDINAIQLA